jgi:hypothetical protein
MNPTFDVFNKEPRNHFFVAYDSIMALNSLTEPFQKREKSKK